MLYLGAGLLIGDIFGKYNINILWGVICMPIIIVANILSRNKKCEATFLCLLFLLCVLLGKKQYESSYDKLLEYDSITSGTMVKVSGKVENIWESAYGITVELVSKVDGSKVICYFKEIDCKIGSEVYVSGKKKTIDESTNPGQFNSKEYYNSKEIYLVLMECNMRIIGNEYSEIAHRFYLIRQALKKAISNICEAEEAGIMCAMLFGDKENLNKEIKDLYTISGIGHILSISGLHISLVGGAVYHMMRKIARQQVSFMVSGGIMLCFCGISGASVSTIRAVIMFMINIFGKVLGRKYDIKNSMSISLIWVLIDNPMYINNGGFILSYLSIAGIAFFIPVMNEIFHELMNNKCLKNKFINALITSGTLYFVTLIAVATMYYEIPVYSIILNMLLLPLMGAVVLSGFVGGILYYIALPIGEIAIIVGVVILKVFKLCCNIFTKFPLSTYITGKKSFSEILIYYLIMIVFTLVCRFMKYHKCSMKKIITVLICGVIMLIFIVFNKKEYQFYITVLDVGQGDCIYVESPDGTNYLIDGGSSDESSVGEYKIEPFIKSRGRDCLTGIFITHTDKDHMSGVLELLEKGGIDIKCLVFGNSVDRRNENYGNICTLAANRGISVKYIDEGDKIGQGEGVSFLCISPIDGVDYKDINSSSIVLLGMYADYRFLLTGDIGREEELYLIEGRYKEKIKNIDCLKVAHHGSNGSSCEEFISWVNPSLAVISCGEDNSYGHPHIEVLNRLDNVASKVVITYEYGAVEVMVYDNSN